MRSTRVVQIFLILGVLLCWSGLAQAQLITIAISGHVTSVSDFSSQLGGQIHIGDAITGTYTYDSATPDSDPSGNGDYWHYSSPTGISLNIRGINFRTDPINVNFLVEVGNSYYLLRSYHNLPLSNGTPVQHISWQLTDPTGSGLSSDALPLAAPDLSKWVGNRLSITGPDCSPQYFSIGATITSASIPEPASAFVLGLGTLLIRRRFTN